MPIGIRTLCLFCAAGLLSGCGGESSRESSRQAASEHPAPVVRQVTFDISGMTCQGCANTIHGALAGGEGVLSDSVSLADSLAFVSYDPARIDAQGLVQIIERLGYRATPIAPEQPGGE